MENRFVQLVPANTTNGSVTAFYALDAQGSVWYDPTKSEKGIISIQWETVVTTRK
jgi:hypothetical protein